MKTIEIGKIVNTHGLRGEVKVVSWCDYPEMFEEFPKIIIGDKVYDVENVKYHKESVILKLSDVDSIDFAEKLKNSVITTYRDYFSLPDGTYFISDIIGLSVIVDGIEIGRISDVIQTGANDVYVIKRVGRKDLLFPATQETVLNTDLESGTVSVFLPEGLDEI